MMSRIALLLACIAATACEMEVACPAIACVDSNEIIVRPAGAALSDGRYLIELDSGPCEITKFGDTLDGQCDLVFRLQDANLILVLRDTPSNIRVSHDGVVVAEHQVDLTYNSNSVGSGPCSQNCRAGTDSFSLDAESACTALACDATTVCVYDGPTAKCALPCAGGQTMCAVGTTCGCGSSCLACRDCVQVCL